MKRKLLQLMLCLGLSSTLNAQSFSYDWHNLQDSSAILPIAFKTHNDKIYTLFWSYPSGDFDVNPGSGVDMMTDSGVSFLIFMTVTNIDGSYVESFKILETNGGTYNNDMRLVIADDGKIIVTGTLAGSSLLSNFNPEGTSSGVYSTSAYISFVSLYQNNGTHIGHFEYQKDFSGNNNMRIYDAVIENDNLYLVGNFWGPTDFDFTGTNDIINTNLPNSDEDAFISKIDLTNQTYLWTKIFGGIDLETIYYAKIDNNKIVVNGGYYGTSLDIDPSSNVYTITNNHATSNYESQFLAVYDLDGNFQNGLSFNGNVDLTFGGFTVDAQSNYYILGGNNQGEAIDFDPTAGVSWLYTSDNDGVFIVKYDSNLNLVWQTSIFSDNFLTLNSSPNRNSLENGGSYNALLLSRFTGYLKQSTNFSSPTIIAVSPGLGADAIVLGLGSLTGDIYGVADISSNNAYTTDIELTSTGDVILQGDLNGDADFTFDDGIYNPTQTSNSFGFMMRINWSGFSGIDETITSSGVSLVPNPVISDLTIQSEELITSYTVLDMSGRVVQDDSNLYQKEVKINLSHANSGCYLVKVINSNGVQSTQRILKN